MILLFQFTNTAHNGMLERILLRTLHASECRGKLIRETEETRLYVEHNDPETLGHFAGVLSQNIPHSLFMKSYRVEQAETIPQTDGWDPEQNCAPSAMPPCPKCLEEIDDPENPNYGNIFTRCEVCGYPVDPAEITLRRASKQRTLSADADHRRLFDALARTVRDGERVILTTMNGPVTAFLPRNGTAQKFPIDEIVVYDVHTAAHFFEMQKGEVLALGSIEKPKIRLLAAREFHEKFPEIPLRFVSVKLPDDMTLFLFLQALNSLGEPLVCLSKTIDDAAETTLTFPGNFSPCDVPEAVVTEEGEALTVSGERGLIPWKGKGFGRKSLSFCGNYAGVMRGETANVVRRDSLSVRPEGIGEVLVAEGESVPFSETSAVTFMHRHAAFFSVLGDNGLLDKTVAGIYLGKEKDSAVMIHSGKFGLVDFVHFDFEYKTFDSLFSSIESMNETGKKLLKNFRAKKQERYERCLTLGIEDTGSNLMTLFGTIGMILGFGDSAAEAGRQLLDNAAEFKGKKGPRIDYKLREGRRLDPLWCIRTAMSFKLADLDDLTLSFGVVESFCEFLSKTVDDIQTDLSLDAIVFCGSLFGEKKILQKTHLLIAKNHPVFFNRSLPMDGPSIAYGALLLTL